MRNTDILTARELRAARAVTLAGIASRAELVELLQAPPHELLGCQVHTLLLACPGIGEVKLEELCRQTGVWPFRRLYMLPLHQIDQLIYRLVNS